MTKTLIGPKLRELRRSRKQTQAQMAKALGVSPAYVNLLENNQRSLSVQMLMAISEAYAIDWRDLAKDDSARQISDLRHVFNDPIFEDKKPELQELRGAIDHAPRLVEDFLDLYKSHRRALDILTRVSSESQIDELVKLSPEAQIHDFFRQRQNYCPTLEVAAETVHAQHHLATEDLFSSLRGILQDDHGIQVEVRRIDQMEDSLRIYDEEGAKVALSQALNSENRSFQLAHVLGLVRFTDQIEELVTESGLDEPQAVTRLRVELANYFAAALMMPYSAFLREAETSGYDIDQVAALFGTSFEQACQRLTTLNRDSERGIQFFYLRIDKAGNVTRRVNPTYFSLAESGGSCPVWNIHTAFYRPGVIVPQFVELPDGQRFFTMSRTVHRPVFSEDTQDRRLTLTLGCAAEDAPRLRYASRYNLEDPNLYRPIGISCHLCPRQACSQRAHQPLFIDLPMDANRRGSTRYES